MLFTLFYFILALLLLVIVHEYGHFLVARCCGVKVLRFSFGFGKVLTSWRDKHGTEYALSLIPLGGYVKMLDETEGTVAPAERHLAFNNQSLLKRTAIVFAGPLFNFLLAFILLWCVLVIGVKSLAPMIEAVHPNSVAAAAGLTAKQEILAINDKKIASWHDFQYAFMPMIGSQDVMAMTVKSMKDGQQKTVYLHLANWKMPPRSPDALDSLGIVPFVPKIPPVVGAIVPDSPAQTAGLQINDLILAVNNQPLNDWLALVHYVKARPDEQMTLKVKRQNQVLTLTIHSSQVVQAGKTEGFLGVSSKPADLPSGWLRAQRDNPIHAIGVAAQQTVELTSSTFALIGRMITGHLSLQSISGPVGIAQSAGDSARGGLAYYLSFMALLSISLGVLNLLPIPMLDGGHLFYYLIEGITRRPLSNEWKSRGAYVGLLLLVVLTVMALTNDLMRLAGT